MKILTSIAITFVSTLFFTYQFAPAEAYTAQSDAANCMIKVPLRHIQIEATDLVDCDSVLLQVHGQLFSFIENKRSVLEGYIQASNEISESSSKDIRSPQQLMDGVLFLGGAEVFPM